MLLALKRVLHLKHVTQCAMLEDFGIFLVLADKVGTTISCDTLSQSASLQSLFAYHIEALVPSQPSSHMQTARTPQKLNGNKDVQFFSVGTLNGRTLVIYMKKKGVRFVAACRHRTHCRAIARQRVPRARAGHGQDRRKAEATRDVWTLWIRPTQIRVVQNLSRTTVICSTSCRLDHPFSKISSCHPKRTT